MAEHNSVLIIVNLPKQYYIIIPNIIMFYYIKVIRQFWCFTKNIYNVEGENSFFVFFPVLLPLTTGSVLKIYCFNFSFICAYVTSKTGCIISYWRSYPIPNPNPRMLEIPLSCTFFGVWFYLSLSTIVLLTFHHIIQWSI